MLFIGHMYAVLAIIIKKVSLTTVVKTKQKGNAKQYKGLDVSPFFLFTFFLSLLPVALVESDHQTHLTQWQAPGGDRCRRWPS